MASIKEFEKTMYDLNPEEVEEQIKKAKNAEDRNFWYEISDRLLQHRQEKTINSKFVL
ncbi:hypothetical protein [uncultured Lactobacillus sp.]|uniref:hypothetical protein n=1 Tax=uncultured Lactobacillus sp. TaxID=153152 RepID=UPI0028050AF3|nr:hypothetical protein [uncultured Lactobacillus sp.]